MSEAVLEAPPQQQTAAPTNPGEMSLQQAMAADIAFRRDNPEGAQRQEAPPQQRQQAAPKEKSAQVDTKQEATTDAEGAQTTDQSAVPRKGGMMDKLAKPEVKKPEEATEYPDEAPKEQTAWTGIKRKVKEYETKEQEWTRREQEYQTKLKQLEDQTSQVKPEDLNALKEYREREAVEFVQRTPEYMEKAQKPWDEGNSKLKEVADFTQIGMKELKDVLMETNSLKRKRDVLALLEGSKTELSDSDKMAIADEVFKAGEKLQDAANAHSELTFQAQTKKEQREMAQKASDMKAKEESQKVLKTAVSEITDGFKVNLADLVEAGVIKPEHIEELRGIQPSDDPMDRAFSEASAQLLVPLTQGFRAALDKANARIAELEADRGARMKTNPSVKPTNGSKQAPRELSLKDAMAAHQAQARIGGIN